MDTRHINLKEVRNAAETLGTNKAIAKALHIPLGTFELFLYRSYEIKNSNCRDFAVKFSKTVQEGKYFHRLKKFTE